MVYFVQAECSKMVKIGRSTNVRARLFGLQGCSSEPLIVLAVILDALDDSPYHLKFQESRSHGEWFNPTSDLMDYIKTLPKVPEYRNMRVFRKHGSQRLAQPRLERARLARKMRDLGIPARVPAAARRTRSRNHDSQRQNNPVCPRLVEPKPVAASSLPSNWMVEVNRIQRELGSDAADRYFRNVVASIQESHVVN